MTRLSYAVSGFLASFRSFAACETSQYRVNRIGDRLADLVRIERGQRRCRDGGPSRSAPQNANRFATKAERAADPDSGARLTPGAAAKAMSYPA